MNSDCSWPVVLIYFFPAVWECGWSGLCSGCGVKTSSVACACHEPGCISESRLHVASEGAGESRGRKGDAQPLGGLG